MIFFLFFFLVFESEWAVGATEWNLTDTLRVISSILGSDGHCARDAALVGGVESPDEEKGKDWYRSGDEHGCFVSTRSPEAPGFIWITNA